ncbi:MAG: hypothetical protein JNK26_05450, partial [Candidatus Doudnabacteria bacterium]|nr:hypothetical protein [Candidatus Doudnabacteria bacterium]
KMHYETFILYNVVGAVIWVLGFVFAGYFFGNIPAVKEHFTLVIFAILALSVAPVVIEYIRHRNVPSTPQKTLEKVVNK